MILTSVLNYLLIHIYSYFGTKDKDRRSVKQRSSDKNVTGRVIRVVTGFVNSFISQKNRITKCVYSKFLIHIFYKKGDIEIILDILVEFLLFGKGRCSSFYFICCYVSPNLFFRNDFMS